MEFTDTDKEQILTTILDGALNSWFYFVGMEGLKRRIQEGSIGDESDTYWIHLKSISSNIEKRKKDLKERKHKFEQIKSYRIEDCDT